MTGGARPGPPTRGGTAVLLAGGRSRRLGTDKALVEVDGKASLARVADAAAPVVRSLVVVSGDRPAHQLALTGGGADGDDADGSPAGSDRLDATDLRWSADLRPGAGPLAGIEAGLLAADPGPCLVLACDLPLLESAPLSALLETLTAAPPGGRDVPGSDSARSASDPPPAHTAGRPPRAVVPVAAGRRQPLCAAVEREAAAVASTLLDAGERSVAAWLERLEVREMAAEDLAAAAGAAPGDVERWLLDVDTPEALAEARKRARSG